MKEHLQKWLMKGIRRTMADGLQVITQKHMQTSPRCTTTMCTPVQIGRVLYSKTWWVTNIHCFDLLKLHVSRRMMSRLRSSSFTSYKTWTTSRMRVDALPPLEDPTQPFLILSRHRINTLSAIEYELESAIESELKSAVESELKTAIESELTIYFFEAGGADSSKKPQ